MATPNAPDQPTCLLGVTERTLSALRDDRVSRDEAARLAAHIETCPACGERLATFNQLADILRSERPPEPDERLWPAIVTASDASSPARRSRESGINSTSASWRRIGALVAVLLLTVGFVAIFSLHRPTPPPTTKLTPSAIATVPPSPLPAQPLSWQQVGASSVYGSVAFAADGASAYKCGVAEDAQGNSSLNLWRTSDRGAHWIPAREVPAETTVVGCQLMVDASDPSVAALAWLPRGGGGGDSYTGLMTTVDGGVTWQAISSQPFIRIDQLDSRGGVIYAIRETVGSSDTVAYHMWASSDRMRTWRQVDRGIPSAVAGFWLDPNGQGILVVTSDGAPGGASQLWNSPDAGATWRSLSVPDGLPSYQTARSTASGGRPNGIVARSIQGQFHICALSVTVDTSAQNSQPLKVVCSIDGGATWQARTMQIYSTSEVPTVGANLVGITNDGALLAGLGTLYRLATGADHWQSLGPLPESVVVYCPSPGVGMLWAAPGAGSGPADSQNRIFTADYTP